jgi:hypothetical protein
MSKLLLIIGFMLTLSTLGIAAANTTASTRVAVVSLN